MKKLIYALKCPFTKEIHYIGKSSCGIVRPSNHLIKSHSEKIKEWVNSLSIVGEKPEIEVLEYVNGDLEEREKYYIRKYLAKGNILLNSVLYNHSLITDKFDKHLKNNSKINIDEIAEFLKVKRKQVGLTQEEFAERAGVALTVVRKIEQGKVNINLLGLLTAISMFGYKLYVKKI